LALQQLYHLWLPEGHDDPLLSLSKDGWCYEAYEYLFDEREVLLTKDEEPRQKGWKEQS